MNIFTAIGVVVNSITNMLVELCGAGETAARTVRKTVSIAEISVDQMVKEQQMLLDELSKPVPKPRATKP